MKRSLTAGHPSRGAHRVVPRSVGFGGASADVFGRDDATGRDPVTELPHCHNIEHAFGPGYSLSGVRIIIGTQRTDAMARLGADALTVGEEIAFRGTPNLWLEAHEAAHVVQQRSGQLPPGGVGKRGDPFERHADQVADRVASQRSAANLLPRPTRNSTPLRVALQAYYGSASGVHDPNAYIPVADLITYIEAVERAYPTDSPTDILTRIRVQYYSGVAFEQLIPGAHTHDLVADPFGGMVVAEPRTLSSTLIRRQNPDAYGHLSARADENALGDNPSPYIVLPGGEQVDLGHLLLGMDALIHPTTSIPYSSYGVPNIDPSSWVADIGIAAVWMTQHVEDGSPPSDAPVHPASPDLNAYWNVSAPEQDLLADIDSFGANATFTAASGRTLSAALREYYLGGSAAPASVQRRFRTFCSANGFGYTLSGGSVTWDPALRSTLIPRVDRFNDLFAAGSAGSAWGTVFGPTRRAWPFTPNVVDRFLAWLKPRLEAEIAAHP